MIFMIKVILCSHCGQGGPVVDKAGLSATPAPNSQASATPATPFRSPWHSKEGPQISISEIGISEMADSENSVGWDVAPPSACRPPSIRVVHMSPARREGVELAQRLHLAHGQILLRAVSAACQYASCVSAGLSSKAGVKIREGESM